MAMKPAQVVKSLAALAQGTRLEVFRRLVEAGPQGLAAGTIADGLRLPPATASFHLARLSQSGLLKSRSEGRYVIYFVDEKRMSDVLAYLTENCCGGAECAIAPRPASRRPRSSGPRAS